MKQRNKEKIVRFVKLLLNYKEQESQPVCLPTEPLNIDASTYKIVQVEACVDIYRETPKEVLNNIMSTAIAKELVKLSW